MKKINIIFVALLLLVPTVCGYTHVHIDDGLDKENIMEFLKQQDLTTVGRIYFFKMENTMYNGYYWNYPKSIIVLYNMPNERWRITLKHELGHNYCYKQLNDNSEDCAEAFRYAEK